MQEELQGLGLEGSGEVSMAQAASRAALHPWIKGFSATLTANPFKDRPWTLKKVFSSPTASQAPLEVSWPQTLEKLLIKEPEAEPPYLESAYQELDSRAQEISQWLHEQLDQCQRQAAGKAAPKEQGAAKGEPDQKAGSSRPELIYATYGEALQGASALFSQHQACQQEAVREAVRKAQAAERKAAKEREEAVVARAREQVRQELLERTRTAETQCREARQQLQEAQDRAASLERELEGLRDAGEQLVAERAARESQAKNHAAQISALENEARRLRASLEQAGREDEVDLTPVAGPLDAIRTLPSNLEECVRLFAGLQDRVEFLDSAFESARDYHGGDLDRYWRSLLSLHDVLWPLRAQNRDYGVDVAREFRSTCGFEYAANESQETLAIEECRRARTFRYQGRDQLMVNHIKVGNSGNSTDGAMRIYLFYDAERKKLIVGHIGKHLPTKSMPG